MQRHSRPHPQFRTDLEQLGDRIVPAGILAVGTDTGSTGIVRTFIDQDLNGTYEKLAHAFQPFGGGFKGGVRVALGDFNGDGNDELVTAMGSGGGYVNVWELHSDGRVGTLLNSFRPFGAAFTGGIYVATGDVDGSGRDELVVSQASAGNSVRIYSDTDGDGLLSDNPTDTFAPFGGFTGGTRVAVGNSSVAGGAEVIVGRGPGGVATVKVYTDSDVDLAVSDNAVLESFTAFANYNGGVQLASGMIGGIGGIGAEIIVGRETGTTTVKIYTDSNASGTVSDNAISESFTAYGPFQGGVRLAAGDTDLSGSFVEVVTGTGVGNSLVRIWDDNADGGSLIADNPVTQSFQAIAGYTGGVWVAFGKVTTASYTNQSTQTIPNTTTTTSRIFVPAGAGLIRDLDVSIALMHTHNADLDVSLVHVPSGTTVILFTDVSSSADGFMIRLDDDAGTDIGAAGPGDGFPVSGPFNPEGASFLSAFDGLDASGEWRLEIVDDAAGDTGSLFNWSLHFKF